MFSSAEHERLFQVVIPYLRREDVVTEIGCGDGSFARLIEPLVKEIVGIDLDPAPGFICGDYMTRAIRPADVVIAHGVLHLVKGDVVGKIYSELNPGGRLIVTLPKRSMANWLRVTIRRFAGAIRGAWLDSLFLLGARVLYPSWTVASLSARVPYLYAIPTMYAGHIKGFSCIHKESWPSSSIAKLDCELRVYVRATPLP